LRLIRFPVFVQIGAGFAIGVLLLAAVATLSYVRIEQMRSSASSARAFGQISTAVRDVLTQLLDEESAVRGYVATGDHRFLRTIAPARVQEAADLRTLDNSDRTKDISANRREQIDFVTGEIEDDIRTLAPLFTSVQKSMETGNTAAARRTLTQADKEFAAVRRDRDALLRYTALGAQSAQQQSDAARRQLVTTLVVSTLLAILAFVAAALVVSKSISSRLATVTRALQSIAELELPNLVDSFSALAQGNLAARFVTERAALSNEGRDEIGALSRSYDAVVSALGHLSNEFAQMAEKLGTTIDGVARSASDLNSVSTRIAGAISESRVAVAQIHTAIAEVAESASQQAQHLSAAREDMQYLSRSAQTVSEGASAQASATYAAVTAVRRLDEQISAFAQLGESLATSARQSRTQAEAGLTSVRQTADAIQLLRKSTQVALETMRNLEERSLAISDIVAVIDEMSDQTNLLALNAAIEAARAGEHGRGFAVVANEVRKLAEQSGASTRKIGDILAGIRSDTLRCAQTIDAAAQQTQDSLALSQDASALLASMSAAIGETSQVAEEVAERSTAMRDASEALSGEIGKVSAVVDSNVALAADMRTTSEQVLSRILPVAASAQQQALTAEEVSAATASVDKQIAELDSSSRFSLTQSQHLRSLLDLFDMNSRVALQPGMEAS